MPTLPDLIAEIVREWPQWSRAERQHGMVPIIDEVIAHCSEGTGNGFIRGWCERVLYPELRRRGRM